MNITVLTVTKTFRSSSLKKILTPFCQLQTPHALNA